MKEIKRTILEKHITGNDRVTCYVNDPDSDKVFRIVQRDCYFPFSRTKKPSEFELAIYLVNQVKQSYDCIAMECSLVKDYDISKIKEGKVESKDWFKYHRSSISETKRLKFVVDHFKKDSKKLEDRTYLFAYDWSLEKMICFSEKETIKLANEINKVKEKQHNEILKQKGFNKGLDIRGVCADVESYNYMDGTNFSNYLFIVKYKDRFFAVKDNVKQLMEISKKMNWELCNENRLNVYKVYNYAVFETYEEAYKTLFDWFEPNYYCDCEYGKQISTAKEDIKTVLLYSGLTLDVIKDIYKANKSEGTLYRLVDLTETCFISKEKLEYQHGIIV